MIFYCQYDKLKFPTWVKLSKFWLYLILKSYFMIPPIPTLPPKPSNINTLTHFLITCNYFHSFPHARESTFLLSQENTSSFTKTVHLLLNFFIWSLFFCLILTPHIFVPPLCCVHIFIKHPSFTTEVCLHIYLLL